MVDTDREYTWETPLLFGVLHRKGETLRLNQTLSSDYAGWGKQLHINMVCFLFFFFFLGPPTASALVKKNPLGWIYHSCSSLAYTYLSTSTAVGCAGPVFTSKLPCWHIVCTKLWGKKQILLPGRVSWKPANPSTAVLGLVEKTHSHHLEITRTNECRLFHIKKIVKENKGLVTRLNLGARPGSFWLRYPPAGNLLSVSGG